MNETFVVTKIKFILKCMIIIYITGNNRKEFYTMKWVKSDLLQYKTAKEYVDTLLIPLVPFQLSNDKTFDKDAFQREVLSLFVHEIEKELTGRVLLTPSYNYVSSKTSGNDDVNRLNTWINHCHTQPFQHTFLITFDAAWKKGEKDINGTLLWFPGMESGNLESEEMQSFVKGQVKQIVALIRTYW